MEIKIEQREGICLITFNRPKVYNSFNKPMAIALQRTLDDCAKDKNVRAIVLKGEGKAFCAGQDLSEATDPNGPSCLLYTSPSPRD